MYQDYQNDQFQIQENHSKTNQPAQKLKSTYEQQLQSYINKESILPKILTRQKSASNYQSLKERNKIKRKDMSKAEQTNSVPKKSFSQYSIVKKKSRSNRYQSLDVNKSKTIQKEQKSVESISYKKKKSQVENIKVGSQVAIPKKFIILPNSKQINKKLTINTMNQSQVNKIQQYFGHSRTELQKLHEDELNRLNIRLHDWIDKFNKRLDDILQKAVAQESKTKSNESKSQKVIQILEKHIIMNKDLLRRMQEENKKLQLKRGQMKEEQYEFLLVKEVERLLVKIKEESKSIIEYRKLNQLSGTKIVSQADSKSSELKLNHLKLQLLKLRRDEGNNGVLLQKTDLKLAQTQKTYEKSEEALQNLISKAGERQISANEVRLDMRYDQMKKKIERSRINSTYAASTNQKNVSKIKQQNKLLRNQIKQYEQEMQEINHKINSIHEKSQLIIKEKQDFLNNSNLVLSNSVQFFTKDNKESSPKITPFTTLTKSIQQRTKVLEKDENEASLTQKIEQKVKHSPTKKNQTLPINIIEQQQHENEFIDINLSNRHEQTFIQKEALIITPPESKILPSQQKQTQSTIKTIPSNQQNKTIKNPRRFLTKKRNTEEQKRNTEEQK